MAALRDRFEADGYALVRSVLTAEEVRAACDEVSAIIAGTANNADETHVEIERTVDAGERSAASRELSVRKLMGFVPHSEVLTGIAEHDAIRDVLRQLIGDDVKLLQDMALLKPPFVGSQKLWHQDCAYFPIEPPSVAGFWIALDRATTENSCMQVIPGTHGQAIPHEQVPVDGKTDLGLPWDHPAVKDANVVPVPLDPGDALVFHGLLIHSTEPNTSPNRRRALQLHYMDAQCRFTGRVAKPAFRQILGKTFADKV